MRPGVCLKVKSVGKPDAVAPHVRFDERGWETGLHATAPVLDSTVSEKYKKRGLLTSIHAFWFKILIEQIAVVLVSETIGLLDYEVNISEYISVNYNL